MADILTKNLQPRLFKKHASKLVTNIVDEDKQMNDVGFFVRCDKIKFPRKKPRKWFSKFNRNVGRKIWPGYIMQQEVWPPINITLTEKSILKCIIWEIGIE